MCERQRASGWERIRLSDRGQSPCRERSALLYRLLDACHLSECLSGSSSWAVWILERAYRSVVWARCHLAIAVHLQPLTKTPTMGRTLLRTATWMDGREVVHCLNWRLCLSRATAFLKLLRFGWWVSKMRHTFTRPST